MTSLMQMIDRVADRLETVFGRALLTTLARFTFAATLLVDFWGSAMTKLGEWPQGLFSPALGAYARIFARAIPARWSARASMPGSWRPGST